MSNTLKYLSYKEAWERISLGLDNESWFEVVAIAESIISDRLLSYLSGVNPNKEYNLRQGFGQIIKEWKESIHNLSLGEDSKNLVSSVDEWRKQRNNIIHGLVKSNPGEATTHVADFIQEAKKTAEHGKVLARAVSSWQRKQHQLSKKQSM